MSAPAPQQRYDRQVRIWGDAGQAALQRASVCVIHATATTTELLKNLVLPGIGSFTLVDDRDVTPALAATSLFLRAPPPSAPSEKVAHQLVAAMQRLNPDVRARCVADVAPDALLASSPAKTSAFLAAFSLVVLHDAPTTPLARAVADACYALNVPLLHLRTAGLVATLRLQLREHVVTDARDADRPPDLRAAAPFAELDALVDRLDLAAMPATDAAHVPFLLLLCKAVRAFRAAHGGNLPASRDEKNEFKNAVKGLRPDAVPHDADNFAQALQNRFLRLCHADAAALPPSVRALFDDRNADPASSPVLLRRREPGPGAEDEAALGNGGPVHSPADSASPTDPCAPVANAKPKHGPDDPSTTAAASAAAARASFWLHVSALRSLYEQTGALPVVGTLPDMAADTASYTRLQGAFRTAAARDAAAALARATELSDQLAATAPGDQLGAGAPPAPCVDAGALASLCKTVCGARVVRGRSLAAELAEPSGSGFAAAVAADGAALPDGAGSAAPFYAALRATDAFRQRFGRRAEPSDLAQVARCAAEIVDSLGVHAPDRVPGTPGAGAAGLWREHVQETLRYGDAELHNVAAFMGGVAAQEAVKLITGLFVPVCDTLVVNFAEMRTVTFRA